MWTATEYRVPRPSLRDRALYYGTWALALAGNTALFYGLARLALGR